ncbi:hypothetical protein ACFX2J_018858 [Malus domestica]
MEIFSVTFLQVLLKLLGFDSGQLHHLALHVLLGCVTVSLSVIPETAKNGEMIWGYIRRHQMLMHKTGGVLEQHQSDRESVRK